MEPQNESHNYYAQMLMRQNPWMKDDLQPGEIPLALSHRKPEYLSGVSMGFIGLFVIADILLHARAIGNIPYLLALLPVGAVLIYCSIRTLFFVSRSSVLVTDRRIILKEPDLLGRTSKEKIIPRSEIRRARLLKSTVMYFVRREDGAIALDLKNGKTVVIPDVQNGEAVLSVLR